ncbi:uncharacterized protein LOC125314644 isoform X2 [Rhodamnia argentea]|uniref:Uncharacterized protein LOC125314644 isoform X2 n=1 Tax=Rhodamnia argentea TaxID=178133 RepID=A0ABM3HA23_9MYRT|nr:uncharacterized protein LOC125314644 isoform X2 [Rhodamnia argentea]
MDCSMNSQEAGSRWSVFDGVKNFPPTTEALMGEINTAIANVEYARASEFLESVSSVGLRNKGSDQNAMSQYDAKLADEAYRAGCAALAADKLDEALYSLNIALSKCPPDKASAVAKLQSLISLTSQQLQKSASPS